VIDPKTMLAAICIAASFTGCSGSEADSSATGFPEHALTTLESDDGTLLFDVRTSPSQPPSRGSNNVQLRVRDAATGAPKEGLSISAVPWMPAMGHGSSVQPSVTSLSDGVYEISNVYLFMPGRWEIRAEVTGDTSHHAVMTFDVL